MTARQVQPHQIFPRRDVRDLAELRPSPDELAAGYGRQFAELLDDVDFSQLAAPSSLMTDRRPASPSIEEISTVASSRG